MRETVYCGRHPKNETNIRCGRCEDTICPDCLVHSPVGMRCPDCAKVNIVPTYDVPFMYMLRGIGAGALTAIAFGVAFFFASPRIFGLLFLGVPGIGVILPLLYVALIAAIGYAVGEAVSLATNRKRGLKLKLVAAGCVFLASLPITMAFPPFGGMLYLFIGLGIATWLSIRPF